MPLLHYLVCCYLLHPAFTQLWEYSTACNHILFCIQLPADSHSIHTVLDFITHCLLHPACLLLIASTSLPPSLLFLSTTKLHATWLCHIFCLNYYSATHLSVGQFNQLDSFLHMTNNECLDVLVLSDFVDNSGKPSASAPLYELYVHRQFGNLSASLWSSCPALYCLTPI